ncbi:DUF6495 family protein [Crocinitomix sp.]|nr:DUF6495 family protein [Crocinitomix sp.]
MAKYRILTKEELVNFEKEFIDFLVVNGIVAEDWEKMKIEEEEKAEKIIDLFSDVVFEGVLRKIQFLELHTETYVQAIQCLSDSMNMVVISSKSKNFKISDFNPASPKSFIAENFELHSGTKPYSKDRELELFEMTERGYQISDDQLFKSLIIATV